MCIIEVDLDEYKEDIKEYYCLKNCLLGNNCNNPLEKLKELVNEMYKNIYIYSENKLNIEDIYNNLDRIVKESEIV